MGNRLAFILAAVVVVLIAVYSSIFVVNAREQAIVVRFGQIQDVKTEPGIYFKLPFAFLDADRVQFVDYRARRFDLDNIRVQVSGGKFYEVDAFLVYKIADAERFRQTVSGDVAAAESRLRTRLDSALRKVYGLRGFEAALSDERASMMREVRDQLRPAAESLGIDIEDVRIRRTDLTKEVSEQTYERMKAERLAEAALIRARGNEAAQRIRAIADRQVVEITSKATRDAEISRGEGDQQANDTYGKAYSKDENFFEFYRSMDAYDKALDSSGTTMVLSPDSEFFRFFEEAGGKGSAASAANGASGGGATPSSSGGPAAAVQPSEEQSSAGQSSSGPASSGPSDAAPENDGANVDDAADNGAAPSAGAASSQGDTRETPGDSDTGGDQPDAAASSSSNGAAPSSPDGPNQSGEDRQPTADGN